MQALSTEKTEYSSVNIQYVVSDNESSNKNIATAFDTRLAGRWKLRIPTGVAYFTDGRKTYRRIDPGAGMGIINVASDESYKWEGIYWNKNKTYSGKAECIQQAFAQEGLTYWNINDGTRDYLVTWNTDNRLPFTIIYFERCMVAGGERVK